MSRWPYQRCAARRLDRTQTKMVRILMVCKYEPFDDPASYAKRCNRLASSVASQHGRWSSIWRQRVVNWNSHLDRARNHRSWAAKTLLWHGREWLQEQRIANCGQWGSMLAGRTDTRAAPGIVHKRWHDGVDVAFEDSR